MKVECTNCGGLGAELWLALFALVSSFVAVWYAKRAANSTEEAVDLARAEVAMARTEHEAFLRELRARARFDVRLRVVGANDDGVFRTDGTSAYVRVGIGIKNIGEKAAGPTTLNVIAPWPMDSLRWSEAGGHEVPGAKPPARTDEKLMNAEGRELDAQFLFQELPRVGRRSHYEKFASFSVSVPDDGESAIPIRVTVEADELPDDEPEISERLMVRVAQSAVV